MLKGFVSGEEKDIVRIPMKGRNLWDGVASRIDTNLGKRYGFIIDVPGTYTVKVYGDILSTDFVYGNVYSNGTYSQNYYMVLSGKSSAYTFTITDGERATIYNANADSESAALEKFARWDIMVNEGSTQLPYEPYGYQEGWEVRDNQDRILWGREDELQTATGTLPFKGYGLPLKVKSLLGNAVQNGTPSPDNIITPEMCGVRTGNLWDRGVPEYVYAKDYKKYNPDNAIALKAGTYTLSSDNKLPIIQAFDANHTQLLVSGTITYPSAYYQMWGGLAIGPTSGAVKAITITLLSDCILTFAVSDNLGTYLMLNAGSTALPYEPYGWAEKITCGGQTVPVYLGEVPTVRRVKKLVLDGTENWYGYTESSAAGVYRLELNGYLRVNTNIALSTHFETQSSVEGTTQVNEKSIAFLVSASGNNYMYIKYRAMGNVADFKAFLASEYAAGTPVTVWYVLAEPTTAIVNEPLAKIGTYADELTTIQVHGLSAPLYGIGDYKDTLNLSTGVVTRKVKKLVLDGTENIEIKSGNAKWYIPIADMKTPANFGVIDWYCSHYQAISNSATWTSYDYMISWSTADSGLSIGLRIRDIDFLTSTTVADFKAYLAAQYQAGTPVTIWYILANEETETVTVPTGMTGEIEGYLTQVSTPTPTNRSVPKWNGEEETGGTYAVTVYTPPEIPTTTGQNTLTVDTTLAPYEVTVEGHIRHGYWGKIREDVRSGVAQTKFPVGTIFYDNGDEATGTAFQVVGYDKHFDPEMTARGYTHSMTLCELKLTDLVTFDAAEALLYVETAIAPGTYRFKIPNYDATYGGNKGYYFTTTKSIPVGGQITINWPYQQTPKTASTYSEIAGVTAIESGLTLSEWIEGDSPAAIDLGTAAGPNAEIGTSSFGKMNHIHRARYGSNNYLQSGIRQYINSDKAASSWWSPQTVFDRPYGSRTSAGKLTKLSSEFVDALVKPEIKSRTNSYFETDSLDGTKFSVSTDYTITTDKMFLLSPNEVGLNADTTIGSTLDYYLNATNADRIKHRASNDAAYYWWLRTPDPTHAYNVRLVYTSGALNSHYAHNTNGVAAACVIQ